MDAGKCDKCGAPFALAGVGSARCVACNSMRTRSEMGDVCERCGVYLVKTATKDLTKIVYCIDCKTTPYCSNECRAADAATHKGRDWCHPITDAEIARVTSFFSLPGVPFSPFYWKGEAFLFFPRPKPIPGHMVPHCMRYQDAEAQQVIASFPMVVTDKVVVKFKDFVRLLNYKQLSPELVAQSAQHLLSENEKIKAAGPATTKK